MSGNIGYTSQPKSDLKYALDNLCDMMSAVHMMEKAKGNIGLTVTSLVCDASGGTLFSYDTVMKYYKDEDGTEYMRAEYLGKVVESIVFEAGMKQTVNATLSMSAAAAVESNPISGAAVGVMVFSTGYSVTKTASVYAGKYTAKLIKAYNIEDKHVSVEGNKKIFEYSDVNKTVVIPQDPETQKNLIPVIKDSTSAEKVQIDSILYDITSDNNNLLVRNAIDDIPAVSFLLSDIEFHAGEKFDVGEQGIYEATSSDYAFSLIAEQHNMTTQQLLKLNTRLIDDGRVSFNQDKVLVNVNASFLTNKDHIYQGTSAEDRLIDMNGGFDTYIANNSDTIIDNDGKGKIQFNGVDLTGAKTKVGESEFYEDDDFIYQELENTLQIIAKENGDTVTIENWSEVVQSDDKKKQALGITLQDSADIEASVLNDDQAFEAQEIMRFNVGLDRELISGEEVVVKLGYNRANYKYVPVGDKVWVAPRPVVTKRSRDPYSGNWYTHTTGGGGYWYQPTTRVLTGYTFIPYGEMTFSEGEQEKVFAYTWNDDSRVERNEIHAFIPHIEEESSNYNDSISVTTDRSGTGTIIDDDFREPNRIDPIILDTNQDGFISTTVLEESNTYFDLTGDGIREKVGWVKPEDNKKLSA